MVKHVILWTIKEDYKGAEKEKIIAGIKEGLESLMGKIPQMTDIKVYTDRLPSSNMDLMLSCTFENAEALQSYGSHPEHLAVADSRVRPYTDMRNCFDFIL